MNIEMNRPATPAETLAIGAAVLILALLFRLLEGRLKRWRRKRRSRREMAEFMARVVAISEERTARVKRESSEIDAMLHADNDAIMASLYEGGDLSRSQRDEDLLALQQAAERVLNPLCLVRETGTAELRPRLAVAAMITEPGRLAALTPEQRTDLFARLEAVRDIEHADVGLKQEASRVIAKRLGVSFHTLYRWRSDFRQRGWWALVDQRRGRPQPEPILPEGRHHMQWPH